MKHLRRGGGRDERGSFIVLWAVLMLAMLTMVAIVIDLGAKRSYRRTNKSIADFAALAAGPKLAAGAPRTACSNALQNIRVNADRAPLNTITDAEITTTCNALAATCPSPLPGATPSSALAKAPSHVVTVSYPVLDADIVDPRLAGGSGLDDGANPCERMRIQIAQTEPTNFAGVIGVSQQTSVASSLVRASTDSSPTQTAALVVLERVECGALTTSGGKGSVLVIPADATTPGQIHADTEATAASPACGGSTNKAFAVYGTKLVPSAPEGRAGQPSILAEPAPSGAPAGSCAVPVGGVPGILDVVALNTNPARAASDVPTGVCPVPRAGVISSRKPVDEKYNSGSPGRITALRTAAAASPATAAAALAAGYAIFPDPALPTDSCTMNTPRVVTAATVYINCAVLDAVDLTFTGSTFVAAGTISVGSSAQLHFPVAKRLVVRGCAPCGNADTGVSNQGTFLFGSTLSSGVPTPCGTGVGVGAREIVVLSGPLKTGSSSFTSLCRTFLYMANQASPYQDTSAAVSASCADPVTPCPRNGGTNGDGYVTIFGTIDWSAANEQLTPPDATHPYEDLALWTEAGTNASNGFDSEIEGASAIKTSGVFFLPNARISFTGQGDLNQVLNAQFIARKLEVSGQGTLKMRADPRNSVQIPEPAWRLIR